jgi:hypothetical protein
MVYSTTFFVWLFKFSIYILGNFSNTEFEDVDVIEEGFVAVNEEAGTRIKEEEIPGDITFPDIKAEPNEVRYICVCVCYWIHFISVPAVSVVFVKSVFLAT